MEAVKPEVMAQMELREIVRESGRLMKNHVRKLTPFLLAFYVPASIIYCLYIYFHHEYMVKVMHDLIIAQQQHQIGGAGYDPPKHEPMSITHIFIVVLLSLIYEICVSHMIASTVLALSTFYQSEGSQWSQKRIFAALPDCAWRLLVTAYLKSLILVGILSLGILVMVASSYLVYVFDLSIVSGLVLLENVLFLVWFCNVLLNVTLTDQIAAVERVWGFAGLKRSAVLLKEKKMTTITLLIFQVVFSFVLYIILNTLMLGPTWLRPIGFVINVALVTFTQLLFITMTTVLYLSCKAVHNEQGLVLPSFVKTSNIQYDPLPS